MQPVPKILPSPSTTGETGAFLQFASTADSTPGAPINNTANSPAPNVPNSDTGSRAVQNSGSTKLAFPNAWGVFKFVDAGGKQKQPDGKYILGYKLGGKNVTVIITPTGGDLFNSEVFSSVKAPQPMLAQ